MGAQDGDNIKIQDQFCILHMETLLTGSQGGKLGINYLQTAQCHEGVD